MTVLLIVLAHALPVVVVAVWSKSRIALILVALISGGIGIISGNPAYTLADLSGVIIACVLGWAHIAHSKMAARETNRSDREEPQSALASVLLTGLLIAAIVVYLSLRDANHETVAAQKATAPSPQSTAAKSKSSTLPAAQKPVEYSRAATSTEPTIGARPRESDDEKWQATLKEFRDTCKPPVCEVVY
jgi:hypothetical protein